MTFCRRPARSSVFCNLGCVDVETFAVAPIQSRARSLSHHHKIEFLLLLSVMSPSQISHSRPSAHAYGRTCAAASGFLDSIVFVYRCSQFLCLHQVSASKNLVCLIPDLAECRGRSFVFAQADEVQLYSQCHGNPVNVGRRLNPS